MSIRGRSNVLTARTEVVDGDDDDDDDVEAEAEDEACGGGTFAVSSNAEREKGARKKERPRIRRA